jgi:hypothetical protein
MSEYRLNAAEVYGFSQIECHKMDNNPHKEPSKYMIVKRLEQHARDNEPLYDSKNV